MRNGGTAFTDKDVHSLLERKGFKKKIFEGGTNNKQFKCSVENVRLAEKNCTRQVPTRKSVNYF